MKIHSKKIISIAVAGKLAVSANMVAAGGLGKAHVNAQQSNYSLSLDEIGYPVQVLTPPNLSSVDNGSKNSTGAIFSADSGQAFNSGLQPRIDFVINHIQAKDTPVVVFLAYSTVKGSPSQWQDVPLNDVFLDRKTMHIVSAFQMDPVTSFDTYNVTSSPLGSVNNKEGNSVIVSLNLSKLDNPEFKGNEIYFQVVAIPFVNGQFVYSKAMTSELDHFTISRIVPNQQGSGAKLTDSQSVVGNAMTSKVPGTGNQTSGKIGSSNSGGKNSNTGNTGGK